MNSEDTETKLRERFFRPIFKDGIQPERAPHLQAIFAHRGEMASREREAFFDEAYSEVLLDLFLRWTQTELHETDLRESLYMNVLAVGSIKSKLMEYETYGRNAPFLQKPEEDEDETTDNS